MSGTAEEVSSYAPRMYTMKINPEKIRDVIGKGGAVIRAITEETGTTIDIKDDGTITIASVSGDAADAARARIEAITADVEVGKVYDGTVLKLLDFGAIVSILPGRMACCTFRRLPTSASTPLPTISRKARKFASRFSKPTRRVACACR